MTGDIILVVNVGAFCRLRTHCLPPPTCGHSGSKLFIELFAIKLALKNHLTIKKKKLLVNNDVYIVYGYS